MISIFQLCQIVTDSLNTQTFDPFQHPLAITFSIIVFIAFQIYLWFIRPGSFSIKTLFYKYKTSVDDLTEEQKIKAMAEELKKNNESSTESESLSQKE